MIHRRSIDDPSGLWRRRSLEESVANKGEECPV